MGCVGVTLHKQLPENYNVKTESDLFNSCSVPVLTRVASEWIMSMTVWGSINRHGGGQLDE